MYHMQGGLQNYTACLEHVSHACLHAGGRGRGDFDDRPPPSFGPNREAELGSAARPGAQITLPSAESSVSRIEETFGSFPQAVQVKQYFNQASKAPQLMLIATWQTKKTLLRYCQDLRNMCHTCRRPGCSLVQKGLDLASSPTARCSSLPTISQCLASWSRHQTPPRFKCL